MSSGRRVGTCSARAALAGNPSDLYGGAVVAVPIRILAANAAVEPGDGFAIRAIDDDLERLLRATVEAFTESVAPARGVLSATTTIPRSVGLAGSSALVIATLRALAATIDHRFDAVEPAQLALAVERDRLGITAGLQDRLVQAVADPVSMCFDPVAYVALQPPEPLPLFVAWSGAGSTPSDTVHRSLRARFDAGDRAVGAGMSQLADQARIATRAIGSGDLESLAAAMDRTFDLRTAMIEVDPVTRSLVGRARAAGAAANSAGSGGSIVGLARTSVDLRQIVESFEADGSHALAVP